MIVDFNKGNGLVPVIIQDALNFKVLMLGYMNEEALEKTRLEGKVYFYSRTRQCLWLKGETSGNYLVVEDISVDCDNDTLLIQVSPAGPTCHTGSVSCFGNFRNQSFLYDLEKTIRERISSRSLQSYTYDLFSKGINKIAQKVGEEAVELIIESKDDNDDLFLGEAADLLFHYLVLLQAKGFCITDIENELRKRAN